VKRAGAWTDVWVRGGGLTRAQLKAAVAAAAERTDAMVADATVAELRLTAVIEGQLAADQAETSATLQQLKAAMRGMSAEGRQAAGAELAALTQAVAALEAQLQTEVGDREAALTALEEMLAEEREAREEAIGRVVDAVATTGEDVAATETRLQAAVQEQLDKAAEDTAGTLTALAEELAELTTTSAEELRLEVEGVQEQLEGVREEVDAVKTEMRNESRVRERDDYAERAAREAAVDLVSSALSSSAADGTTAELRLQAVLEAVLEARMLEAAVGAEAAAAAAARGALREHGAALAAVTAKVAALESGVGELATGGVPLAALQQRVHDQAEAQSLFMDAVTQVCTTLVHVRFYQRKTPLNSAAFLDGRCYAVCSSLAHTLSPSVLLPPAAALDPARRRMLQDPLRHQRDTKPGSTTDAMLPFAASGGREARRGGCRVVEHRPARAGHGADALHAGGGHRARRGEAAGDGDGAFGCGAEAGGGPAPCCGRRRRRRRRGGGRWRSSAASRHRRQVGAWASAVRRRCGAAEGGDSEPDGGGDAGDWQDAERHLGAPVARGGRVWRCAAGARIAAGGGGGGIHPRGRGGGGGSCSRGAGGARGRRGRRAASRVGANR
jgi:archaellum component FlaC